MKSGRQRRILLGLVSTFAFVAAILPRVAAENLAEGKRAFAQCAGCHSTKPGANGIGPSLAGVAGRRSGQAPGYDYSTALKQAKLTWNAATLEKFLRNPQAMVPGVKMFISVPNEQRRRDVIAYLQTLHQ
jgi:cytochrome c